VRAGTAASLIAAVLLTAGCGTHDGGVKTANQVDLLGWRSEFVARSVTSNDPDMDELYLAAAEDCDASVDDMALKLAEPSVDPSLVLMGLKYVCPGRQSKVNTAMAELQNSVYAFNQACTTPPDQRTAKQQQLVNTQAACAAP
jgi:hypothetical protein